MTAIWLAASCGGENNVADCDKGNKAVPCSERTGDENARLALENQDYATAISLLEALIAAEPTVYARYPLCAAAHAGRAGISILELAKAQFSGGGSSGGLLASLATFLPDPQDLGDAGYDAALADVRASITYLDTIPEALRAATSGESYASSARLQLTLYRTTFSVMYLNKFAIDTQTGAFDASKLATMTEADALIVLDNLAAVAAMQAAGNPALQAKVNEALASIEGQDGATKAEKLKEFLTASQAGSTPAAPAPPAPAPAEPATELAP